jgi:hypothetical protein
MSLSGQFSSVDEFVSGGVLTKFIGLLREIKNLDALLYKKYDFFISKITRDNSIRDVLVGTISRKFDEIRRFKTLLSCLFDNPYWEDNQKHRDNVSYMYNGNCVTGKSLAEACERDRIVASFVHKDFHSGCIAVVREGTEILLDNLVCEENCFEMARNRGIISFEEYCIKKFAGGKLDFSSINKKEGFPLITREEEDLFLKGIKKFTVLTWPEINKDIGFEYKEYNENKKYFKSFKKKIHKFRISEKYRCFGYVEQGIFHVLLFDLTHKKSDKG